MFHCSLEMILTSDVSFTDNSKRTQAMFDRCISVICNATVDRVDSMALFNVSKALKIKFKFPLQMLSELIRSGNRGSELPLISFSLRSYNELV